VPSLRKRIRSRGRVTWDIRYREAGKQRTFLIGETDRRTAERIFDDFCERLSGNKSNGGSGLVVSTADAGTGGDSSSAALQGRPTNACRLIDLKEFALTYARANKSQRTAVLEEFVFNRLSHVLGNPLLSELTPPLMEQYKAARLQVAAPATINIELRVLSAALHEAAEMGWTDLPTKRFKQIRQHDPEAPQWLTREQIDILIEACDETYRRFVKFALNTGCRRNEILGVMWEDIDLNRRQIVIRPQSAKMGRRRSLPISDTLLALLNEWPQPRTGPIFPDLGSNQVTMAFRRIRRRTGLPDGVSVHTLRSTFASHLIEKGVNIYVISRLLGHSSVKVTERYYLALDPEHVQSAINQLDYTGPPNDDKVPK
jgi:integrase